MNLEEIDSIDLTDPENLDVKQVSLEITHRNNLYDMRSPVSDEEVVEEDEVFEPELPKEKWMQIIDRLAENGVEYVTLTGGEPTVRSDFHDILGYAISRIDNVTVQTHGNTDTALSGYDCLVSIYVEDHRPLYHNSIFRKTDPEKYELNMNEGSITDKKGGICKLCDKRVANLNGARMHIKHKHGSDALQQFNSLFVDKGIDPVETYDELKTTIDERQDLSWFALYDKKYRAGDLEDALQRCIQKADKIENDVVIRSTIYGNNNVEGVMTLADNYGFNTVFIPVKPVGRARENFIDQVPSPNRMKEVCGKVYSVDGLLGTNHEIDSPVQKAAELKEARQNLSENDVEEQYLIEDELEKYWGRGRISDVGVSKLNVLPDGTVTVSRYLRDDKDELGSLLSNSWGRIMDNLAEWNEGVEDSDFERPAEGFDLRRRSIASDLEVLLNHEYR